MSGIAQAGHGTKRRVRRFFTGLWAGLFVTAIGWLAIVTVLFFSGLAQARGASFWGTRMMVSSDGGLELSFDGPAVFALVGVGAAVGALIGVLVPLRKTDR